MASTLERIQKLEESMAQVVAKVTTPDPMLQMMMNKSVGIEQSVAAMGKMLSAISEELSETEVLDSLNVMARLRSAEDDAGRDNVKALLAQNIIEVSDVIDDSSLVAIEQKIINTESGESRVIASYNLIGMNSPATSAVWKDSLIGKKIGDTVKGINSNTEEEILTVVEVYGIKEREVEGEGEGESMLDDTTPQVEPQEISFDGEETGV